MEKGGEEQQGHHQHRLCDYCDTSVALVYCKADSAKLCLACDKQVHVTNQLFSKHFRSLLCDSCDDSPSSVYCETERSLLCQNCDWQHHSSSSSLHTRRPFEGFSGCPSVTELMALVGLHDLTHKPLFPYSDDLLLWDTPDIVSVNDMTASGHSLRATDVPPLPKNRHATCGKHKEEMIRQLRELARSESSCLKGETQDPDSDLDAGFQFLAPGKDDDFFSSCEVSGLKWFENQDDADFTAYPSLQNNENLRGCPQEQEQEQEQESSRVMMVPVCTPTSTTRPVSTLPCHELNSLERNTALSRYKEKKKSRRYEKHIRYESRKVRAETRTRIRGRFAKSDHP
uniref:Zinc finger protein CONSTANS-LIKE 13 n=1 Tax=Noccaea caerulescens TaxID=107243 RepID=A0A1J3HKF5_NOCCA